MHQFLARDCSFYGIAGTEAVAQCHLGTEDTVVIGPSDGELVPAVGIPSILIAPAPRLSPDGQTMLVRAQPMVVEFTRSETGWTATNNDAFPPGSGGTPFSSIAQTGSTLRVLAIAAAGNTLLEYERANGTWSTVQTTPLADVLVTSSFVTGLALTSDGLRLVIATGDETRYSDRPSLDVAFRPSESLGAPAAMDVFVTDDCARIYLSGLGSVFYAQRL